MIWVKTLLVSPSLITALFTEILFPLTDDVPLCSAQRHSLEMHLWLHQNFHFQSMVRNLRVKSTNLTQIIAFLQQWWNLWAISRDDELCLVSFFILFVRLCCRQFSLLDWFWSSPVISSHFFYPALFYPFLSWIIDLEMILSSVPGDWVWELN